MNFPDTKLPADPKIRLNRFLAMSGLGARRSCERFIRSGRIRVNGAAVSDLGTRVDPEKDKIELDGKPVLLQDKPCHLILNKPEGYVVSRNPQGGRSVFDLLTGLPRNLNPAGRLDADSRGLLFLSTDGELLNRLSHPRFHVSKIYIVRTRTPLSAQALSTFRNGITLDDGPTQPAQIESADGSPCTYRIILTEGRNRQIRRMMEALNSPVTTLTRVAFGPLRLGRLKAGNWRHLTRNEMWKLKRNMNLK